MKLRYKFIIVALIGLPIGFLGRQALRPPMDRVASAIELFELYCVPFSSNTGVTISEDMVRLANIGVLQTWGSPQSNLMLELNTHSCVVSDTLESFSASEQAEFSNKFRDFVKEKFPMLQAEESILSESWDLHEMWMQYRGGDPRRWGVTLGRYEIEGAVAMTSITAYVQKE
ncbi:MAG: hypothetical protein COB08_014020 [Rhodobacteraceae bacterium]|nr:hypothetical protein [Paracoccaceae bacterium]